MSKFKVGDVVTVDKAYGHRHFEEGVRYKITSVGDCTRLFVSDEVWKSNGNQGWAVPEDYLKLVKKQIVVICL